MRSMSEKFVRLSVLWEDHQMDVSLPAYRPLIDYVDDIIGLFYAQVGFTDRTADIEQSAHPWALSSPVTGLIPFSAALADVGVKDGQQLFLTRREDAAQAPFVDDVMKEMRNTIGHAQWTWSGGVRKDMLLFSVFVSLCIAALVISRTLAGLSMQGIGLLGVSESDAVREGDWTSTRFVLLGASVVGTILLFGIGIWQPRRWTRWLGLGLPLTTAVIAASLLSKLNGAEAIAWWLGVVSFSVIPALWVASRATNPSKDKSFLAGSTFCLLFALAASAYAFAVRCGASPYALMAWGAWFPALLLLITPSMVLSMTGLAALLRRHDEGLSIDRETIRRSAVQTERYSRGICWFAIASAAAIIVTLASGPYWQQGLIAAVLSVVVLLRTNSFADSRIMGPLLVTGTVGLSLCAGSAVNWKLGGIDSVDANATWWLDVFGEQWPAWSASLLVLSISIAAELIAVGHQPDELDQARVAKFLSFLDTIVCVAFIPLVLFGQGVYAYFWATT